jgi:aryl-alcohol dehydrogenase-like predicted oxidoreductase
MEGFVKEGKIRYYACSNFDTDRMLAAYEYCSKNGYRGFVGDQCLMNLAMKYMNEPADPTLRCIRGDNFDYHVVHPELVAMPFFGNCAGYFHKYLSKGAEAVKDMYYDTEKNRKVAENVKKLAEKYECSITQAVMGFFRFQPFTCVPLYGTSSPEHIIDACKTLDVPFTAKDYEDALNV